MGQDEFAPLRFVNANTPVQLLIHLKEVKEPAVLRKHGPIAASARHSWDMDSPQQLAGDGVPFAKRQIAS
jgi:hypothetical protein